MIIAMFLIAIGIGVLALGASYAGIIALLDCNMKLETALIPGYMEELREFCRNEGITLVENIKGDIEPLVGKAEVLIEGNKAAGMFVWKRRLIMTHYMGMISPTIYIKNRHGGRGEFYTFLHEIGHYLIERDFLAIPLHNRIGIEEPPDQTEAEADYRGFWFFFSKKTAFERYVFKVIIEIYTKKRYIIPKPKPFTWETITMFFRTKHLWM